MKATIYALVDPNTHQVRYVGRTRGTVERRLQGHIGAATCGTSKPVYDWMRSLLPAQPLIIVLQEGITVERKGAGTHAARRWWTTDDAAETKWMKGFWLDSRG